MSETRRLQSVETRMEPKEVVKCKKCRHEDRRKDLWYIETIRELSKCRVLLPECDIAMGDKICVKGLDWSCIREYGLN